MTSLGKWVVPVRRPVSVLVVTAMSAAGLTAVAAAGPAGAAATRTAAHAATSSEPAGDETTGSQNNLRDGWDPNEPALYKVAWRDVLGSHPLEVPISGTGVG
jgi:hypothetical protein